ncbi:DUF6933 domain-containing protein [Winogradskyella luteola]|uniref:DUF6933 domain-containing protein n=1 Tax=Winogradskyella luteola TaxID=2828330 RepID=A0A9X1FD14_9FLAO|nr:hypothetical protein [Winogradskyella luteola]MBV7270650.1 hypothetical protein [Winogradskyella luteola]
MRVFCSKKLTDYIVDVDGNLPEDSLALKVSDWNAHLFTINRRKSIVFVHARTHYSIFLIGVDKQYLGRIGELFAGRLLEQLRHDGIDLSPSMEKALGLTDGIMFYGTNNNRSATGRINDFIYIFKSRFGDGYGTPSETDIRRESGAVNATPIQLMVNGKKVWTDPIEQMHRLNDGIV